MFSRIVGLYWDAPVMSKGGGWLPGLSFRLGAGEADGVFPGECNGEAPADNEPEKQKWLQYL